MFCWDHATSTTAWQFLTHRRLGGSKRPGMTYYLRHALQFFKNPKTANVDAETRGFCSALLTKNNTNAVSNAANNVVLQGKFKAAFDSTRQDFITLMSAYCCAHPVYLHQCQAAASDGDGLPRKLLPAHGDINALARVCVLMSLPEAQPMWQHIANEGRSRVHVDNPQARLVSTNEEVETQLLNKYVNCASFQAPHAVSLAPYNVQVNINPTMPPNPPKSVAWLREARADLKRIMAACTTGFVYKTGRGHGSLHLVFACMHMSLATNSECRWERRCRPRHAVLEVVPSRCTGHVRVVALGARTQCSCTLHCLDRRIFPSRHWRCQWTPQWSISAAQPQSSDPRQQNSRCPREDHSFR